GRAAGFGVALAEVRPRASRRAVHWLAAVVAMLLSAPANATMPPLAGPVAPEIADAFSRGLFQVPERPTGLSTSAAREDWFIPIIRVEFTDSAIVHTKAELERRLFDSTG